MEVLHLLLAFLCPLLFSWHWLIRNKKSPVYDWPLLGMLPSLLWNESNVHEFFAQALRRSGGTFLLKGPSFINSDYMITSDAMNCHHIFSRNSANYDKGPEFKMTMEPLGDGIFNVDGELWKFQRQLIHSLINNAEFESHMMTSLRSMMESKLFRVLDDASKLGTVIDIQDVFKRFTFDNMCSLVLGFDPCYISFDGSPSTAGCGKAFDELEEAAIHRLLVPIPMWKLQNKLDIGIERKAYRAWKIMDEFLYHNIKIKKDALLVRNRKDLDQQTSTTSKKARKHDLLTQLILLGKAEDRHENGDQYGNATTLSEKFSDKCLRDTTLTLVAAGRDSISVGLTWFFWVVARNPEIKRNIMEEIKQVIAMRGTTTPNDQGSGRNGTRMSYFMSKHELNKLVYLHAVVCETFQLYSPVPLEYKCAVERDVLPSGHVVSRGTKFLFSIYSMGRMEEIWGKDCMEFKPERWISERGGITHVPSYKFMVFLAGPRACLGKNIAFISVPSLVLIMKNGFKTRVSKRDPPR
ncbi:Alkane hydroxylase MAH1 [Linum grandiflorum]